MCSLPHPNTYPLDHFVSTLISGQLPAGFIRERIATGLNPTSMVMAPDGRILITEKNGKMVPEKVGLKSIQRDGTDYEFTLVFDLDIKNNAVASKDRTGLFVGKPETKLSVETGKTILDWCNEGLELIEAPIEQRINDCRSIEELLALYKTHPRCQQSHLVHFTRKRNELNPDPSTLHIKKQENGTDNLAQ